MDDISALEWYAVGVLDGLHGKQEGIKGREYSDLTSDPLSYYSYNKGWWDGRKDQIETDVPLCLNHKK